MTEPGGQIRTALLEFTVGADWRAEELWLHCPFCPPGHDGFPLEADSFTSQATVAKLIVAAAGHLAERHPEKC